MSTDDGKRLAAEWHARMVELQEQRDELLALVKYLHTPSEDHGRMSSWDRDVSLAITRAERNP